MCQTAQHISLKTQLLATKNITVNYKSLKSALKEVLPSAMKEILIQVPQVSSDIMTGPFNIPRPMLLYNYNLLGTLE